MQNDSSNIDRLVSVKQPGDSAEFQMVWVAGYDSETRYAVVVLHSDISMTLV